MTAGGIVVVFDIDLILGDLYLILFVGKVGAGGFVVFFCFSISYVVGIYGNRFGFGLFGKDNRCRGFSDMVFSSAR